MIDEVAVKQELLKRANSQGSLSNEAEFRASIERLQGGIADHRPSVVDISSSAEKRFSLDVKLLFHLAEHSPDPTVSQLCEAMARIAIFLASKKDN